ncbi:MAG TPA: TIGR00266 family protein [Methanothermococcus okinawensis]|uniref:TIGR00266 family protein n=1 Tax=Methanothermococcus okinawensis TaxID=155863 RepID=A0A832ZRD3_9EURY|nr:TIGR00266 family protein [Methanothermococcus okinawensis]HIP91073.1 TIGR00266 family protein [Methanothermococcus okinawensis]
MTEYDFKIEYKPAYSLLKVFLKDQSIIAETGSMVYMSKGIEIDTNIRGGLMGALKRMVVGENLFLNKFHGTGTLALAPNYVGDITHYRLDSTLYVQSGAYLASSPEVEIGTKLGDLSMIFGGMGLFLMKLEGKGDVFLSSFGALETIELEEDEIIVDNGNLVGFTEGLEYSLKKVGGLKATIFSGEGKVYEFRGTGKIFIQTRNLLEFGQFLSKYIMGQNR